MPGVFFPSLLAQIGIVSYKETSTTANCLHSALSDVKQARQAEALDSIQHATTSTQRYSTLRGEVAQIQPYEVLWLVLPSSEMACRSDMFSDTCFRTKSSYRSNALAAPPGGNVLTAATGLSKGAQERTLHVLAHAARLRGVQGHCLCRLVLPVPKVSVVKWKAASNIAPALERTVHQHSSTTTLRCSNSRQLNALCDLGSCTECINHHCIASSSMDLDRGCEHVSKLLLRPRFSLRNASLPAEPTNWQNTRPCHGGKHRRGEKEVSLQKTSHQTYRSQAVPTGRRSGAQRPVCAEFPQQYSDPTHIRARLQTPLLHCHGQAADRRHRAQTTSM